MSTRADLAQPAGATTGTRRLPYLDNLKVALIALIIALHAVLGYSDVGWWSYGDAREVTLSDVSTVAFMFVVGPLGLILIPLLFLVAGLLTPASIERKGPRRFARDRLLRLGVPFVVYVVVIQPPVVYLVDHRWGNAYGSYWSEFLGADGQPDTGPLWFVGALLVYSLAYAGWVALRPTRPVRPAPITARDLGTLAAAIVIPTFAIRLAWPVGSESFTDLNLWEWPACATLFGLGVVAAHQGWAAAVPAQLHQQCRRVGLVAALALLALAGAALGLLGVEGDLLFGGWHWAAFAFAACESVIAVFGAVWALGFTQRLDRPYRWTRLAPASYAAFIVQTPVLLGAAVALRPLDAPAEVKALLVAAVSVPAAFALGSVVLGLIRRLGRGRARVSEERETEARGRRQQAEDEGARDVDGGAAQLTGLGERQ